MIITISTLKNKKEYFKKINILSKDNIHFK